MQSGKAMIAQVNATKRLISSRIYTFMNSNKNFYGRIRFRVGRIPLEIELQTFMVESSKDGGDRGGSGITCVLT